MYGHLFVCLFVCPLLSPFPLSFQSFPPNSLALHPLRKSIIFLYVFCPHITVQYAPLLYDNVRSKKGANISTRPSVRASKNYELVFCTTPTSVRSTVLSADN